jgi:hypothetical protein
MRKQLLKSSGVSVLRWSVSSRRTLSIERNTGIREEKKEESRLPMQALFTGFRLYKSREPYSIDSWGE